MTISADSVAALMIAAGFPATEIATGKGIVAAESGGNPLATNHNSNGSTDYGLWQINSIHTDLLNGHDWKDPAQNTVMALQIWKDAGNKWTPWSTFNSGAYRSKTLTGTDTAATGGALGVVNAGNSAPSFVNTFKLLTDPKTYYRVALFILGSIMVAVAVVVLMHGGSVSDAATTVAKAVK